MVMQRGGQFRQAPSTSCVRDSDPVRPVNMANGWPTGPGRQTGLAPAPPSATRAAYLAGTLRDVRRSVRHAGLRWRVPALGETAVH